MPRTIRQGSKGPTVARLQELLVRWGWHLVVDADFGPATDDAVEAFQASQGLVADGIVGPTTWNALQASPGEADPVDVVQEERDELERAACASHGHGQGLSAALRGIWWLGVAEVNGSNRGPDLDIIVEGYNEFWGIDDDINRPWCAMFVSQCLRYALEGDAPSFGEPGWRASWEDSPLGAFMGGTAQLERWAEERGVLEQPHLGVLTGTIFTMARQGSSSDPSASTKAGHCGIVVAVDGDVLITIEGNTSNRVRSLRRRSEDLRHLIPWWEA